MTEECNNKYCKARLERAEKKLNAAVQRMTEIVHERDEAHKKVGYIEAKLEVAEKELKELAPDLDRDECSLGVLAARMIKDKYSYDSISGIWWSEKSKPGILEKKDEHITSLEAKLSIALAEVNKHLDEVKRLRIVANKYAEAYYHKSSDNGKGGVRNGMPGEPVSESRVDKAAPPETHTPEKSEGIKCAKCGSEAVLVNNGATYSDDVYCLKCGEIKVKRKQVLDGKWSQWR